MRIGITSAFLIFTLLLMCGCDDSAPNGIENSTGTIKFGTINPIRSGLSKAAAQTNPPLVGDTTTANTTSFLFCVGDVWVSQQEVLEGQGDSLEWIRLTSATNTEYKLFEDYSFSAVEIPAGSYKSIKITFKNLFYRFTQLISDTAIAFELLETMGSWTDVCDLNDTTWAPTNYFSSDGNHVLGSDSLFELVSEGEKLGGFSIEAGVTALVNWRLGAGVSQPCITYMIDENSNGQWDCGIDRMDFACPPEAKYMWDFVVSYE